MALPDGGTLLIFERKTKTITIFFFFVTNRGDSDHTGSVSPYSAGAAPLTAENAGRLLRALRSDAKEAGGQREPPLGPAFFKIARKFGITRYF